MASRPPELTTPPWGENMMSAGTPKPFVSPASFGFGSMQMPAGNCKGVSPVSTRGWRMIRYSAVAPAPPGGCVPVIDPGNQVEGAGMKLKAAAPAGKGPGVCTVIEGGTVV